jgi:hypothetical protein
MVKKSNIKNDIKKPFKELPDWVQKTIIYSNAGKFANEKMLDRIRMSFDLTPSIIAHALVSKYIRKNSMSDKTKAVVKIRAIAERLVNLTHRLEQDLAPDAYEKLLQDFADEVDKLEEIVSGL